MTVHLPSPLLSYTKGASELEVQCGTLAEMLAELDRRFPGIRFRIIDEQDNVRPHIRLFVNAELVRSIDHPVRPRDDVTIVAAVSGG